MASATITTAHEASSPKPFTWDERISAAGPWNEELEPISLDGVASLPMPVHIAEPTTLESFFEHLRKGGTNLAANNGTIGLEPYYTTEFVEFEKGILYVDGRMDLCKMVTGPRNIGALMDSLRPNSFARHFLLGNNIIGPVGATAIASFIDDFPDRFETWYLAGNCIDTTGFKSLVNAMIKSTVITNVWLKRNPLKRGAVQSIFRLITQSKALRTLDLDQTELGDAGVAELFSLLADHDQPIPLQHIYLNAIGISYSACTQISRYLATKNCRLISLYASLNPIGDAAALLAPGVKQNTTLSRLALRSCGLKDAGILPLIDALTSHPSLLALDLGQAYATTDLGMRWNWLASPETAAAVATLISSSSILQYLNLSHLPMSHVSLQVILRAAVESKTLLWFHALPINRINGGRRSHQELFDARKTSPLRSHVRHQLALNVKEKYHGMDYEAWEAEHKRFLISPPDVRYIDSMYRNRDAGLARRGLKTLDKVWEDGDETLNKVQDGVIV